MQNVSDNELIRRQMMANRSGMPPMQVAPHEKSSDTKEKIFNSGYALILKWVEDHAVDGLFSSKIDDSVPPVQWESFKVDPAKINASFWKSPANTESSLQEIVGYSDDMVLHMYNIGTHFVNEKEYQKAITVFDFLALLDPSITLFLVAKGFALEGNDELAEAMSAFEKSIQIAPTEFDAYLGMIRCSEKNGDFTKVKELLQSALEHPSIAEDAKGALEYISSLKGG